MDTIAKNLAMLSFDLAQIIGNGFAGEQEPVPAMLLDVAIDAEGHARFTLGCARLRDAKGVATALIDYGFDVQPFDALCQRYDVEAVLFVTADRSLVGVD